MEHFQQEIAALQKAFPGLAKAFSDLPEHSSELNIARLETTLAAVAERMQDNYPYQHPHYVGQMIKPPHPVARMAYMLAMYINPNNHALDGGRASSALEKEAVASLAAMYGWPKHLGHLTSGGTMANMEALWIASREHPDKIIVGSDQAHYTHSRISEVLGIPYRSIPTDAQGRMDLEALEQILETETVGTVVATIGTTGCGVVDPLPGLLALKKEHGFRIHADCAYGGYFKLATTLSAEISLVFDALAEVDSLVIDPHKHGLQPYGCGCILFQDPEVGKHYSHDSPYTYFSSDELHLGEISLECSRAGAAAVALWATQQYMPHTIGGEFSLRLNASLEAAQVWYQKALASAHFEPLFFPSLDIILLAPKGNTSSEISTKSQRIFDKAAKEGLHLALFQYPAEKFAQLLPAVQLDTIYVTCIRCCLMKPEHLAWADTAWKKLETVVD